MASAAKSNNAENKHCLGPEGYSYCHLHYAVALSMTDRWAPAVSSVVPCAAPVFVSIAQFVFSQGSAY